MKLQCANCGHFFDGSISYDELGWHSYCKECNSSFDTDVPTGKIIMLFADDIDDWTSFSDDHTQNEICSYYAFDSVNSFIRQWRKKVEEPDSMWYWVIDSDNGRTICSGACDPNDRSIFKDYFGRLS